MDICQACFKEVRWDPEEPSFDCGNLTCGSMSCGANGALGRFVHIDLDCGGFRWAMTGLERET